MCTNACGVCPRSHARTGGAAEPRVLWHVRRLPDELRPCLRRGASSLVGTRRFDHDGNLNVRASAGGGPSVRLEGAGAGAGASAGIGPGSCRCQRQWPRASAARGGTFFEGDQTQPAPAPSHDPGYGAFSGGTRPGHHGGPRPVKKKWPGAAWRASPSQAGHWYSCCHWKPAGGAPMCQPGSGPVEAADQCQCGKAAATHELCCRNLSERCKDVNPYSDRDRIRQGRNVVPHTTKHAASIAFDSLGSTIARRTRLSANRAGRERARWFPRASLFTRPNMHGINCAHFRLQIRPR